VRVALEIQGLSVTGVVGDSRIAVLRVNLVGGALLSVGPGYGTQDEPLFPQPYKCGS